MKVYVCLALVFMGACDVPPPEEKQESRAEAWHGGMSKLEPGRPLPPLTSAPMTSADGTMERHFQAIGWYGGNYSWGYCNTGAWPACGTGGGPNATGYIAFYFGPSGNYTGDAIQFWTTGAGNNDVWMDLDYYTRVGGGQVNNATVSTWMFRGPATWTQKAWLCGEIACNAGQYIQMYSVPGTNGSGHAFIPADMTDGLSAFWFLADY
jgi:hypothetical protein